jgi:hypothetical protein
MNEGNEFAGSAKITEYTERIRNGEPKESILQGLPDSWQREIENRLNTESSEVSVEDFRVPVQYEGLPAEIIDELWIIPVYVDNEKTKTERERKEKALAQLYKKERDVPIAVEERNLYDAHAQSRMSEIRQEMGVPEHRETSLESKSELETMSVEDFAIYFYKEAIARGVKLSDGVYDVLTTRNELREIALKSAFGDSSEKLDIYAQNIDLIKKYKEGAEKEMGKIEGTQYVPGQWDHYKIRYEDKERNTTSKGYLTIDKDQVLERFTPAIRKEIVERLRDNEYNGQVKFPITGSRALFAYDNIVIHGNEPEDVEKGLEIIQAVLTEHNLTFEAPRRGVDRKEGNNKKSYTQRIAELVEQAVKTPGMDLTEEIKKLKEI